MADNSPFTVLCVDDSPEQRLAWSIILRDAGYRVLEAGCGSEALALVKKADLVILDVQLPDLNGFEICQRIKADPATGLVPVILLSGYFTRSEDQAEGLEGGGDVYLTKPVEPRVLVGQVKALRRIRLAELALQEQAKMIDQIHDAVIATDLTGRITRWNKGAERLLGYTAEEMLGRPVATLCPNREGEQIFPRTLAALKQGGGMELEMRLLRRSGDPFYVHSSFALLQDARGEPTGIIGYSIEITERRRLEEQYRKAQRLEAVGQLAGGLAHDFNNLLTVINGFAEIVIQNMPYDNPQRGLVEEIKKAGDRAAALTQQLLAFSRKQILQLKVLELNGFLSEMENAIRRAVGAGVQVAICPAAQPSRVKVDPVQIRMAIMNLALNAAEAMTGGGTLRLETRNISIEENDSKAYPEVQPGPYILLMLRDTGVGMDAATKARIFEPFFTTKAEGELGGGLGLATVYGIVKQSGGHIEVSSELGAGTTFTIYLPQHPE